MLHCLVGCFGLTTKIGAEVMGDQVWAKLKELEDQLFREQKINQQLRRANSKQKNVIRRLVKERDRLQKELHPAKQRYVNINKGKR